jgi:hypothetical protein
LVASCCAIDRRAVQLPTLNVSEASENVTPAYRTERRTDTECSESATVDEDRNCSAPAQLVLPSSAAKSPRNGGIYSFA